MGQPLVFIIGSRRAASKWRPVSTIGGRAVPVQYAGAQGSFAGLDQLNILLPSNLRGAGTVTVLLTVDGVQANAVTISIQ